jgi:dTDP-4-dehydrorhamnose 3,5-epimerase
MLLQATTKNIIISNTQKDNSNFFMPFTKTEFPGLLIFEPLAFEDERGFFFESYNERIFQQERIDIKFVQDNQSHSKYGVIRGLHYQLNPYAQTKLVRVLRGKILDVVVDMRKGSPQYAKPYSIELSADNKKQLFIPKGFAHGFSVLSETADVIYKCDSFYNKESEAGIIYNDIILKIDWQLLSHEIIVSQKDLLLGSFTGCKNNFEFEG